MLAMQVPHCRPARSTIASLMNTHAVAIALRVNLPFDLFGHAESGQLPSFDRQSQRLIP
jgi:hypothetical protein